MSSIRIILNKSEEKFIINNYNKIGPNKISQKLGYTRSFITTSALRLNVKINKNLAAIVKVIEAKDRYEKYKELLNFNNPISCYMLGFLWADGHLTKVDKNLCRQKQGRALLLLIKREDGREISKIYKRIIPTLNVKNGTSKRNGKTLYNTSFNINNLILHEKLLKYSYDKKSYVFPSKLIKNIPQHNLKYFIHGFFDGDGNVKYDTKGMYGFSLAMDKRGDFEHWQKLFKKHGINLSANFSKNTNGVSLVCSNRAGTEKFYNLFIKNDIGLGLKRKIKIFKNIINAPVGYKANRNQKKVYQFDDNFILIKTWDTTNDVIDSLNCKRRLIYNAVTYGYKSLGFYWSRSNIFDKNIIIKGKDKSIKSKKYCADKLNLIGK